jgi:hypothetical protein
VSPYRLSLNSLVLFGGLLGGAAIAFLLSLNAGRFVVSDDLSTQFGIPLIGVVTRLHKTPDTKRFAFSALALSSGVALLLVCYAGVVVLLKTSIYQVIGA